MTGVKAENILDVLKIPFVIGQLHFITQNVRSSTTEGLQKSTPATVYTIIVLLFYCWNVTKLFLYAPSSIFEMFLNNGYTWFFANGTDNIIVKLVLLDGILSAYCTREKHILFFEKINTIDTVLSGEFAENINYNFFRIYAIFINILPIIYLLRVCINAVASFSLLKGATKSVVLNIVFPFYFENSCNFLLAFQYATDVLVIRMRFRALSKVLSRLNKSRNVSTSLLPVLLIYSKLFSCIDIMNKVYGNNIMLRSIHDFFGIVGPSYMLSLIIQSTTQLNCMQVLAFLVCCL